MVLDYSKFEQIEDSDDEVVSHQAPKTSGSTSPHPATSVACSCCSSPCHKPLMCSKCKAAAYCSATCQKQDWQFHKRNCREPVSLMESLQKKIPGMSCVGGQARLQGQKPTPQIARTSIPVDHTPKADKSAKAGGADDLADANTMKAKEVSAPLDKGTKKETHEGDPKSETMGAACNIDSGIQDKVGAPHSSDSASQNDRCKNCIQRCLKPLRCSVCKEATYCSSKCQKEDWRSHKLQCKKAKPKVLCYCGASFKDSHMFCGTCGARRPDVETATGPSESLRPRETETEHVDNDEVQDWYRHRDWKPQDTQEFHPSRIADEESAAIPSGDGTVLLERDASVLEEKDMVSWWLAKLASLKLRIEKPDLLVVAEQIVDVSGGASIVDHREQKRFLFDFRIQIDFDVTINEKSQSGYPMETSSCGQVIIEHFSNETRGDFRAKIEGTDVSSRIAKAELLPELKRELLECISDYEKE